MTAFHLLQIFIPLTLACLAGKFTNDNLGWQWGLLTAPLAILIGYIIAKGAYLIPLALIGRNLRKMEDDELIGALVPERWTESVFICTELKKRNVNSESVRKRLYAMLESDLVFDKEYIHKAAMNIDIILHPNAEQGDREGRADARPSS